MAAQPQAVEQAEAARQHNVSAWGREAHGIGLEQLPPGSQHVGRRKIPGIASQAQAEAAVPACVKGLLKGQGPEPEALQLAPEGRGVEQVGVVLIDAQDAALEKEKGHGEEDGYLKERDGGLLGGQLRGHGQDTLSLGA